MNEDALAANLANGESRMPVHVPGYGLKQFSEDPSHLSDVVRYDAPALGDLTGLRVAHLPCRIGTDHDMVYTAVGVVGWLPSMVGWGRVIADLLAPGGRLYLRDGHPMLMTLETHAATNSRL